MSGIDVLRAMGVRADGQPHPPPVVMFSADDDEATREKLMQLCATDFVSKINPDGLLRVVSAYVRPTNTLSA